jgi:hypothetical protein
MVISVEEQLVKFASQAVGWLAFAIASLVGWAVRTSVFNRLTSIERQISHIEKVVSAAASRAELAEAMKEVRVDVHNVKMEINSNIQQVIQLLKG